jgi:iron complex outermembrane receptor protein
MLRASLLAAASLAAFTPCALASEIGAEGEDIERIVVTGGPLAGRAADEMVVPVTVVYGDELARRMAGSIGEVLDGLPGVANADFGPGVGRPTVRGQQGSRVTVLDDGMPVADVSGEGVDHAVAIDSRGAQQIEIFRGPSTLMYGSGAAGGVVNVRSFRFLPEISSSAFAQFDASYSPNGDDKQIDLQAEQPLGENFALRFNTSVRHSNDFSIRGFQEIDQTEGFRGRLQNSSISTELASLTAIHSADWGFAALGGSMWSTEYGIPEVFDPREIRGPGSDEFERVFADFTRLDLRSEINTPVPGISLVRFKAAWTDFEQDEIEFEFSRDDGSFEDSEIEARFENQEIEARLDFLHEPVAGWEGVFGLQVSHRDFFADDPRGDDRGFYVRPNQTRTIAGYLVEERETGFGRIELGARVENTRSESDPVLASDVPGVTLPDGSFLPQPERIGTLDTTAVSLSAGAIFDLDADHALRFSAIRSERTPSPEQRYAFGRHSAAGTWEVGDPTLSTERYVNLEAGFQRHSGRLRYELTAFYNRADDYIFLTSEDDGTGNPVFVNDIGNRAGEGEATDCAPDEGGLCRLRNQLVFYQQDDADFYGLEFGGSFTLIESGPIPLTATFMADIVRGELRDGGPLPRITPARFGVGLSTRWRDLDLRADWQRVTRQNQIAEAESETEGFDLVSLDASYDLPGPLDASVYLKGRNLLDQAGRRHQSFFKEEAPIIGRAFYVGIRARFGGF